MGDLPISKPVKETIINYVHSLEGDTATDIDFVSICYTRDDFEHGLFSRVHKHGLCNGPTFGFKPL